MANLSSSAVSLLSFAENLGSNCEYQLRTLTSAKGQQFEAIGFPTNKEREVREDGSTSYEWEWAVLSDKMQKKGYHLTDEFLEQHIDELMVLPRDLVETSDGHDAEFSVLYLPGAQLKSLKSLLKK